MNQAMKGMILSFKYHAEIDPTSTLLFCTENKNKGSPSVQLMGLSKAYIFYYVKYYRINIASETY